MALIITVLIIFLLLAGTEIWWRKSRIHDEFSRKFIHISVGSFAAFFPFFLDWNQILYLSAAFVAVVNLSQYFGVFKAIHSVDRKTYGEVCFALAVGGLALFVREPLLYAAALLHMSLADGAAALVGTAYGRNNSYKVFGHRKSLAGTGAFVGFSLLILICYATVSPEPIVAAWLVLLALAAAGLENVAVRGLDNLFVPLLIAGSLIMLS